MTTATSAVDLDRLFKLRLVVARYGEMDAARWWNTQGVLGSRGALVYKRGFTSTHRFVQARVVFAVARSRCHELFDPPGCMTLWSLPAELEDQFDERWQTWLDDIDSWEPTFKALEKQEYGDLLAILRGHDLVTDQQVEAVKAFRRSAEGRSVPIPGTFHPDDGVLTLLAAGFARGEQSKPAVPYVRLET